MILTPSRRVNCTLSPANCPKPAPPCQPALAENTPVTAARQGSFPAAKAADQVESKTGAVPLVDAVRAPSLSPSKALEKASALELSSTALESGVIDKVPAGSFAMENRLAKSASLKPLKNEPNGMYRFFFDVWMHFCSDLKYVLPNPPSHPLTNRQAWPGPPPVCAAAKAGSCLLPARVGASVFAVAVPTPV